MKKSKWIFGITLLLSVFILLDTWSFFRAPDNLLPSLANPEASNSIISLRSESDRMVVAFRTLEDPYLVTDFAHKSLLPTYLELKIEWFRGAEILEIYYTFTSDPRFQEKQKLSIPLYKEQSIYRFALPPGDYSQIRIDFTNQYAQPESGQAVITSFRRYPPSLFWAYQLYSYPMALLFFVALVLPGSLLFALFSPKSRLSKTWYFILFFPLSIVFYFSVYLVHLLTLKSMGNQVFIPLCYWLLSFSGLFIAIMRKKRLSHLKDLFLRSEITFIFALFILCSSILIITFGQLKPYETVTYRSVIEDKLFSLFNGGDNFLQYYNGMAIACDKPFSDYYEDGNRPLSCEVQERQILAGVIYGAFLVLLKNIPGSIPESYFTYTLFGICLNLMVIFPVALLFTRFFRVRYEFLLLLFFSVNAFILSNYYYTWFKFAGASLFLGGVICLLEDSGRLRNWVVAGLLFGLSTNFHSGNALGIPLVFLFFVLKEARINSLLSRKALLPPILLCTVFVLLMLPWSIVKSRFFPDDQLLFRHHFLKATPYQGGMWETISEFFTTHPLSEQPGARGNHLLQALRLDRVEKLVEIFSINGLDKSFLFCWSNNEFFFIVFSIYQLLLLLVLAIPALFFARLYGSASRIEGQKNDYFAFSGNKEPYFIGLMAFLTTLLLIFSFYGSEYPDVNHVQPYGLTLILHIMLISLIAKCGRVGYALMILALLFNGYRLLSIAF